MSDTTEKGTADLQAENMRLRAAIETDLPPELADRLKGSTHEELLADAGSLRTALGIPAPPRANPFDGGTVRGTRQAPVMTDRDEIRILARRDPRKFNQMAEQGLIDLKGLSS